MYTEEQELAEFQKIPWEETEAETREQPEDQERHELYPEPTLDIPMITEDPEVIAEREGVPLFSLDRKDT